MKEKFSDRFTMCKIDDTSIKITGKTKEDIGLFLYYVILIGFNIADEDMETGEISEFINNAVYKYNGLEENEEYIFNFDNEIDEDL